MMCVIRLIIPFVWFVITTDECCLWVVGMLVVCVSVYVFFFLIVALPTQLSSWLELLHAHHYY